MHSDKLGNVFDLNEPIAFRLDGVSGPINWSVKDFFGRLVASGHTDAAGAGADIRPVLPVPGYFTLSVTAGDFADADVSAALAVLPQPAEGGAASPFGVVTHFAKGWDPAIIPLIARTGIKHVRDEQPWRQIEKQPGEYRFNDRLAGYMAALAKYGLDPLIVLAFSNPLYDDDKTPFSDSGRRGYAAYASAVVSRYRPNLDRDGAVEIWNEYNGSFCTGPCKQDPPRFYADMLSAAYRAIKQSAPEVTVLGGAGVPIPLPYYRNLFKHGALDSMDALVIHPYRKTPEGVEDKIGELRDMMAQFGPVKPIWATEFSDLADMRKSRDDAARYLVRTSTLLLSAGVERITGICSRILPNSKGLALSVKRTIRWERKRRLRPMWLMLRSPMNSRARILSGVSRDMGRRGSICSRPPSI